MSRALVFTVLQEVWQLQHQMRELLKRVEDLEAFRTIESARGPSQSVLGSDGPPVPLPMVPLLGLSTSLETFPSRSSREISAATLVSSWDDDAECSCDSDGSELPGEHSRLRDFPDFLTSENFSRDEGNHSAPAKRNNRSSQVVSEGMRALTVHHTRHFAKTACQHEVSSSVWEAVVMVNLNTISAVDNVLIVFGLVANLIMQIFFCYIVGSSLAGSDRFPAVESLLRWRYREGHSTETMDQDVWSSMVSRVCNGDDSLGVSTFQQGLISDIGTYMEPIFGLFFIGGPQKGSMLALVVLILFFTTIGEDVMDSFNFFRALARLRGKRTVLKQTGASFELESISARRFAFMTTVTSVRVIISFALAISGAQWLARTTTLSEVIVNTTAITFVQRVDEALYKVFFPVSARVLVATLKPLQSPPLLFGSTDVLPPVNILLTMLMALYVMQTTVMPGMESMRNILHAACGGDQDFIIAAGHATGFPVSTHTTPFQDSSHHHHMLMYQAVREAMWAPNLTQITKARVYTDPAAVAVVSEWTADEVARLPWFRCEDATGSILAKRLVLLRDLTGFEDARTCDDLRSMCSNIGMTLLRLTCPHTCGCDSPVSGIFFGTDKQGCPHACRSSDNYVSQLSSMTCADTPAAALRVSSSWATYLRDSTTFLAESNVFEANALKRLRKRFLHDGCQAIAGAGFLLNISEERAAYVLCPRSSLFTTLHAFCPEACACRVTPHESCPPSCKERRLV